MMNPADIGLSVFARASPGHPGMGRQPGPFFILLCLTGARLFADS
ncbi:MAG: hypothetical protein WBZ29_11515 [Methanocella sp.]